MDISLNFIILAVLALISLIIIALYFTGTLGDIFGQTKDIAAVSAQTQALYKTNCDRHCTFKDKDSWDHPAFPEVMTSNGIDSCDEFYRKYYDGSKTYAANCAK